MEEMTSAELNQFLEAIAELIEAKAAHAPMGACREPYPGGPSMITE